MDGIVTIGTKLDTKSFDAQITQLEKKLETLEKSADESDMPKQFRRSAEETRDLNAEIEKTRNQLNDLYRKQNQINKAGLSSMNESLKGIGGSMKDITRKVVKWGLAIFGIRSMYMMIRQSMGVLSQYDDQMATDLEYIRYAIATALKPIIETVLNLVKQLLFYVNYLAKAWFKVDLFAGASAKNFSNANKQAKKLNKTLASFDEMNVLSDNSSQNGGGTNIPSFDLSDTEGMKIPKWLEWIKDNGELIAAAIALIIGSKILGTGLLGLTGLASTLAQIGIIAIGVDLFYKALTGRDLVQDIKDIYNGLKELSKAKKNNEKMDKKTIESTTEIVKNNKEVAKQYEKGSQEIARMTGALRSNIEMSRNEIETGKYSNEQVKRRTKLIEESIETYKSLYEQGKLTNAQTEEYRDLMGQLGLKVDGTKMNFEEYADYLKFHYDKEVQDANKETSIFGNALANLVNQDYNIEIDSKINKPDTLAFRNEVNDLFKKFSISAQSLPLLGIGAGAFTIPKLAVGGIINNPGRGIPIGGAIAGESGAEGVIPLTDSQQMSLLGEAIGRYITVNLTNITKLDGRQIARKVDKVNQSNDFVFNR